MFAITRNQRIRRDFIKEVRKIHKEHFGLSDTDAAEQNQTWSDWLVLKKREWRDLRSLSEDVDIDVSFRARALTILLVPYVGLEPFAWPKNESSLTNSHFMLDKIAFKELPEQLLQFVFKLLPACMKIAYDANPESESKVSHTLFFYRHLVQIALEVLPEEDSFAETLFNLWQPLDPIVYWNMETCSGYDALGSLLRASVPDTFKRRADQMMRDIVIAELNGETEVRAEHEHAGRQYMDLVQMILYSDEFPYEIELFASQVEFLIGLDLKGETSFNNWHVHQILGLLSGDQNKDLRRHFSNHVVLGDHTGFAQFKVYNVETMRGACMMLGEFGDEDLELGDNLRSLIQEAEARFAQEREAAAEVQANSDAVKERMRA